MKLAGSLEVPAEGDWAPHIKQKESLEGEGCQTAVCKAGSATALRRGQWIFQQKNTSDWAPLDLFAYIKSL